MSGPEERIFAWWEYDNDHRPLNRWSEDADADQRDRFGHAEYIRADLFSAAIARAERAEAERDRYSECLVEVSGSLHLPHGETGPCDDAGRYGQELTGLEDIYQRTEVDLVAHRTERFKAEAALAVAEKALRKIEEADRSIMQWKFAYEALAKIAALKGGAALAESKAHDYVPSLDPMDQGDCSICGNSAASHEAKGGAQ